MKWTELIEDTAWVVEDLLLPEECKYFLQRATEEGLHEKRASGDVRHRNSTSISLDDEEMAHKVFERIKDRLPQKVIINEETCNLGIQVENKQKQQDLFGTWKPYTLNYKWRFVRYNEKGHFGPHRDGCRIEDDHHRSLITINGYLTDRPVGWGGATRFLQDDISIIHCVDTENNGTNNGILTAPESAVLHRVEADKAGKAVVFFHDLMHDGEPLKEGSPPKYLFRTEIMYERDPATAPQLSKEQIQGRQFLCQAQKAEEEGNIPLAIQLYSKAFKLDPDLDT